MKRINLYSLPIVVTVVFAVVFSALTIGHYCYLNYNIYIQSKTTGAYFVGEALSLEKTDHGYLVTVDNHSGSSKYPGTQKCLIHSQTKVYDTEFSELAKGSTGMTVTILTDSFYIADYTASDGAFVFSARHFRIHLTPPTDPTDE